MGNISWRKDLTVPTGTAIVPPMLRIRELRLAAGLSQSELARASGLAEKTIRRAEKTGRASGATLARLAIGLDCSVGHLFIPKEEVAS